MISDLHEASAKVLIANLAISCDKRISKATTNIGTPDSSIEDLEN